MTAIENTPINGCSGVWVKTSERLPRLDAGNVLVAFWENTGWGPGQWRYKACTWGAFEPEDGEDYDGDFNNERLDPIDKPDYWMEFSPISNELRPS